MKIFFIFFLLLSCNAFAYIGPGMGSGVIAAIIGILAALIISIFGIFYFPIKRIIKKRKSHKKRKIDLWFKFLSNSSYFNSNDFLY